MVTQSLNHSTSESLFVRTAELKPSATGVWFVHYSDPPTNPGGPYRSRRLSLRTKVRAEAQAKLSALKTQDTKATEDAKMDRFTIHELADYYLTHHAFRKGDTARRSFVPLERLLGHVVPSELTPQKIAAYITMRRKERDVADGTLRRELGALVACLNYTRKHGMLSVVPSIELPPQSEARVVFMDAEQAQQFWDAAMSWQGYKGSGRRIRLFVALALETAARKEAIYELTWDRVNFRNKTLDYRVPGRPSTNKRRIALPISDRLLPVLEQASVNQLPQARVVGLGSLRKSWETFARDIGMPWVTPHVCRHTWATLAFADGVPIGKIAAFLGDTVETVTRNYIHPQTEHLRDIVNRRGATT